MSSAGKAFSKVFKKPKPAVPCGIAFTRDFEAELWASMRQETGCGWFRDRFLYLFGEGLDALLPCLDAWRFLVPRRRDRMILGRNAYGALLVLDDANDARRWSAHVLDPFLVQWISPPQMTLGNLVGAWLPEGSIPGFLDDAAFKTWVKREKRHPQDHLILAPQVPKGLGGELSVDNLREEDPLEYYRTTGEIYAKRLAARPAPIPAERAEDLAAAPVETESRAATAPKAKVSASAVQRSARARKGPKR